MSIRGAVRRTWVLLAPALILIAVVVLASFGSSSIERKATVMAIHVMFVVGLYLFVGNSGVLSFGHASFMAIGAYVSGLLTASAHLKAVVLPDLPEWLGQAELPTLPTAFIAGLAAAVFALAVGVPLMRLSGLAAGIATLSLLIIVNVVISHLDSVTGGLTALSGIPRDTGLFTALAWALGAMLVAFLFQESRAGLRLRASREDEAAARAIGIGVVRERTIAFVLSAAVVGMSGAVFAHYLGSITAALFYFPITFLTVAMLVVGGINSLAGAVIGTIVVSAVNELLRNLERGVSLGPLDVPARPGLTEVGLALVLIAVLILRPRGITGCREIRWPWDRPQPVETTGRAEPSLVGPPAAPQLSGSVSTRPDEGA